MIAKPLPKLIEHLSDLLCARCCSRRPGYDHVVHGSQLGAPQAKCLSYLPPDPVAQDSPRRHPARNSQPQSRGVRRRVMNPEQRVAVRVPGCKDPRKITARQQPGRTRQSEPRMHGRNYRPGLAARRLRPLARRALMIARPDLVAMRARKPWRRSRLILLG